MDVPLPTTKFKKNVFKYYYLVQLIQTTNFTKHEFEFYEFKGRPSVLCYNINSYFGTLLCILVLIENFHLVKKTSKSKQMKIDGKKSYINSCFIKLVTSSHELEKYLVRHISTTNPEFWIHKFFTLFFFLFKELHFGLFLEIKELFWLFFVN